MIPKTIVEHDKSGLEMVLVALEELLEERFVEGIKNKHRSLYEIGQTAEMVMIYQHRVNIEAKAVIKFSETFIGQFATDNNQCFDTAEILFGKIRSTLAGLKKVFYKTTTTDRRQLPDGVEPPMVYNKSPLGHGDYTPDMFGLESFPEPVQNLYHAFETLFTTSSSVLALCRLMIEQEEETRNDIIQLRQIYNASCDELLDAIKAASVYISSTQELPENELEERRKKAGSDDVKFLKEAYHRHNKKELTQFLVIKCIKEARNGGLTQMESFFWNKNQEKALTVRKVIENFDLVQDVEGQEGKLSSTVIVEFLKWCGVKEHQEKELYEKHFRPQYIVKGKYNVLGWNTISGKRKELKDLGDTNEKLAKDFETRLSAIFPPQEKNAKELTMIPKMGS